MIDIYFSILQKHIKRKEQKTFTSIDDVCFRCSILF